MHVPGQDISLTPRGAFDQDLQGRSQHSQPWLRWVQTIVRDAVRAPCADWHFPELHILAAKTLSSRRTFAPGQIKVFRCVVNFAEVQRNIPTARRPGALAARRILVARCEEPTIGRPR